MNCTDAAEILERMIFEEVRIDADLRHHVESCTSCSQAYRDALNAREVLNLVRRSEPVPANPREITDHIMAAIQAYPRKTPVFPLLLQRLLAAASVIIFLLFGYEQYHVVKKVSALEIQFSEIRPDSRYSNPLRCLSAMEINNAGISFSEIEKLLAAEKRTTALSFSFIKKRLDQRNNK